MTAAAEAGPASSEAYGHSSEAASTEPAYHVASEVPSPESSGKVSPPGDVDGKGECVIQSMNDFKLQMNPFEFVDRKSSGLSSGRNSTEPDSQHAHDADGREDPQIPAMNEVSLASKLNFGNIEFPERAPLPRNLPRDPARSRPRRKSETDLPPEAPTLLAESQVPIMDSFRLNHKSLDLLPEQVPLPRTFSRTFSSSSRAPSRRASEGDFTKHLSERSNRSSRSHRSKDEHRTDSRIPSMNEFRLKPEVADLMSGGPGQSVLPRAQAGSRTNTISPSQLPIVSQAEQEGDPVLRTATTMASLPMSFRSNMTVRTGCSEKSRTTAMRKAELDNVLEKIAKDKEARSNSKPSDDTDSDSASSTSTNRDDINADFTRSCRTDTFDFNYRPLGFQFDTEEDTSPGSATSQDMTLGSGRSASKRASGVTSCQLDSIKDEDSTNGDSDTGSLIVSFDQDDTGKGAYPEQTKRKSFLSSFLILQRRRSWGGPSRLQIDTSNERKMDPIVVASKTEKMMQRRTAWDCPSVASAVQENNQCLWARQALAAGPKPGKPVWSSPECPSEEKGQGPGANGSKWKNLQQDFQGVKTGRNFSKFGKDIVGRLTTTTSTNQVQPINDVQA